MEKLGPVAIIGAGISGLSCAQSLLATGIKVTVFEGAPRVGGRCATRLWQSHLVDHGVQYFTAQTPEFKRELLTRLRQFRPIVPPILDHADEIVISPGGPRFYVLQGNNYFAQVLTHGLDVRVNTPIDSVYFRDDGGIRIFGEIFRAVVSALPAPQTARLFALPESPADYSVCVLALLEYSGTGLGDSLDCYAHLQPDDSEPLIGSYCENHKAGRIVGDKTVFVAHGGHRFSLAHADEPPEKYVQELARANEDLWKIPAGKCTASFGHRWQFCWPQKASRRRVDLPGGAFSCGDSRVDSTVEDVWLDGRRAAEEVIDYLATKTSAA